MPDGGQGGFADCGSYRPPAPTPLARPIGPLALAAALKRNPLECWTRRHFEAPVVEGGLPFGHVALVSDPAAIRRVLLDNAGNYRKDRLQRRVLSAGLGDGLLSAEGDRWREQRRLAAPMFALRSVRSFAPAMARAAEEVIGRWPRDGAAIDADVEMRRVTLNVLERTIFTDGFGRDAEAIRQAMGEYFDRIGRLTAIDLIGLPDFIPRPGARRVTATLRFFGAAIDDLIAGRRRLLTTRPANAPRDMLTQLLRSELSEAEVRSNILTFFAAGHETTANALTWTLLLLSQSPHWRERVEYEAATVRADGPVVIRAVIEEALRLYPPIAAVSRVAVGPDELAGVKVRKRTLVVISPYVLHRHRRLWDDPDAFDPGRFLGKARAAIDRFAYLPFGVGPRTCIGAEFAMQEACLVLAAISRRFRLELAPGQRIWPCLRVTLRPAEGARMVVSRRWDRGEGVAASG